MDFSNSEKYKFLVAVINLSGKITLIIFLVGAMIANFILKASWFRYNFTPVGLLMIPLFTRYLSYNMLRLSVSLKLVSIAFWKKYIANTICFLIIADLLFIPDGAFPFLIILWINSGLALYVKKNWSVK